MKPEKPEAQVAAVQSDARSPVQDVQEPVSTEATDEKSWQQMPDMSESMPIEEHGVNTYTAPAADPPALSS